MKDDIALIFPYFQTSPAVQHLFQPLGIASLASQIKALGLSVKKYDCTFERFDTVVERVAAAQPAIVGISIMVTTSRNAFRLLAALQKELPETLFVAGGPLPTLYPERFSRAFDVVFGGESDLIFPRFCSDYLSLRHREQFRHLLDFSRYPGVYLTASGGLLRRLPLHHPAAVINRLPLPDRSADNHHLYQSHSFDKTGYRAASIMPTRGCPFSCDFCSKPVFGTNFRRRSLGRVFDEIGDIRRYGYDQLWVADDLFTFDPGYLHAFCRMMQERAPDMTWTCLSRANGLCSDTVALMRDAGCAKVYLGLESGSDRTLRLMKKKASVADGIAAVHLFHGAGIRVAAFFIVGYPGESRRSIGSTFDLALSLPLDEISFNVPFPLPGSPLYERVTGPDPTADWDVENETRFIFKSEFDAAWLKAQIQNTMRTFEGRRHTSAETPVRIPQNKVCSGIMPSVLKRIHI